MAKQLAAEASWAAADMCVQTHGGFGFAEEFDIERKFRETRLYTVAPISTNLVLVVHRRARARPAEVVLGESMIERPHRRKLGLLPPPWGRRGGRSRVALPSTSCALGMTNER